MNLSQLYYFKKLAEVQHYTKAAKELYITQLTLSNSISQLEKELGIPLFERENRAVRLTQYGKEFHAHVTEALNALDKGIDIAHEHVKSLSGTIEVGTVYTIQGDYLPALIAAYRARYGCNITINVSQGLTIPLIEDLELGRYEIVFAARVPDKPDLTFVPVLSHQLVAIMHDTHPLARFDELSFRDLAGQSLYSYPPQTPVGREVELIAQAHDVSLSSPHYNDEITLGSMVQANPTAVGLALNTIGLSPFKNLAVKPISDVPNDFHTVCLVYKTNAFKSRALENFIAFVKDPPPRNRPAAGTARTLDVRTVEESTLFGLHRTAAPTSKAA